MPEFATAYFPQLYAAGTHEVLRPVFAEFLQRLNENSGCKVCLHRLASRLHFVGLPREVPVEQFVGMRREK